MAHKVSGCVYVGSTEARVTKDESFVTAAHSAASSSWLMGGSVLLLPPPVKLSRPILPPLLSDDALGVPASLLHIELRREARSSATLDDTLRHSGSVGGLMVPSSYTPRSGTGGG